MTEYHYSNGAPATTLSAYVSPSDDSLVLASMSGLPAAYPYTLVLDYQEATQEVVSVTGAISGALSVTRGEDGTSAQEHNAGAVVVHAVVARDLAGPQAHMAADAAGVHGVSGSLVGTSGDQTLTGKTLVGCPSVETSQFTAHGAIIDDQVTIGTDSTADLVRLHLVHGASDASNFMQAFVDSDEQFLVAADGTVQANDYKILGARSLPRGLVFARRKTTDLILGVHDTEADLYTKTLTLDGGRVFRVRVTLNFNPVSSDFGVEAWLWDGAYRANDTGVVLLGAAGAMARGAIEHIFTTTGVESHTFKLTIRADSGKTFDIKASAISPFLFEVEDLGPASSLDVTP